MLAQLVLEEELRQADVLTAEVRPGYKSLTVGSLSFASLKLFERKSEADLSSVFPASYFHNSIPLHG